MKKQFEELAKQASYTVKSSSGGVLGDSMNLEKYSELLVMKCVNICLEQRDPPNLNYKPSKKFSDEIKRYFGLNS